MVYAIPDLKRIRGQIVGHEIVFKIMLRTVLWMTLCFDSLFILFVTNELLDPKWPRKK